MRKVLAGILVFVMLLTTVSAGGLSVLAAPLNGDGPFHDDELDWDGSVIPNNWSSTKNVNDTLLNGTFEKGSISGWTIPSPTYIASATVSTTAAHTGRYGVSLWNDGGWSSSMAQVFSTTPGKKYTLTFWAKASGQYGYNVAVSDYVNNTMYTSYYVNPHKGTGWKKHTLSFVANSYVSYLRFIGPGTDVSTTMYVDDFVLTVGENTTSGGNTNAAASIKQQIGNINLGPYALKGATLDLFGDEVPLIDIEAGISLEIGDHLKIDTDKNGNITVLIGFDEDASANIGSSEKSDTYWSDSYKEVKAMYQQLTGQKVDTTQLWNRFSAMRGKLKTLKANMVVDVEASLMGYMEFKPQGNGYVFSEGGIMAGFEADADLRSYYGPFFVTLGVGVGADGSLFFTNENNKINPQISISTNLTISAGVGAGSRDTYAAIVAYGTLGAVIATNTDSPFSAGVDLGVRGVAYLLGHEILNVKKSFAGVQLYPDFGGAWPKSLRLLPQNTDLSTKTSYESFINAGEPLNRDYLSAAHSVRRTAVFDGASFVKDNSFLLNSPQLVSFANDTMLLLWIDDTGEKTSKNIGSLMYSFYDGAVWSTPAVLFEDGTYNDIPYVCSDGNTAYFVWQKANKAFDEGIQTSDMLPCFDLYFSSFDSNTQIFTDRICLTPEDDATFELLPTVDVTDGIITVAWAENTDNNVFQMSGTTTIKKLTLDSALNISAKESVVSTSSIASDIDITNSSIYYALLSDGVNTLYQYHNGQTNVIQEGVLAFDCENGRVFYSSNSGFFAVDEEKTIAYDGVGALQNFAVKSNDEEYVLFTEQVNEDFSKTLYYNKLTSGSNEWSGFEVYADRGKFIKDYAPVMLNDGTVYVAVNYTDDETQFGTLAVEQCTESIDISLSYVDFDETLLRYGAVDLLLGIDNHSSTVVDTVSLYVIDEEGNIIDMQTVTGTIPAFGSAELSAAFTLPEDASDKKYTFEVFPAGYAELDESNNTTTSTFTCIHIFSDELLVDTEATDTTSAVMYHACDRCNAKMVVNTCGEHLTHVYDDICDFSCNECGTVREPATLAEDIILSDVYHSITMEEETGNGLAFRFSMDIVGVEYIGNQYVPGTGTITLHGETHTIKRMGAIVSNDADAELTLNHLDGKTVNVEANYLLDVSQSSVAFAVRVVNIPETGNDVVVCARPYYIYECDGVEKIVYGDVNATTYHIEENEVNN